MRREVVRDSDNADHRIAVAALKELQGCDKVSRLAEGSCWLQEDDDCRGPSCLFHLGHRVFKNWDHGRIVSGQLRGAKEWNLYGNVGLVVGATYPEELKLIRQSYPDMPLLIPGIGSQGGDLALTVRYGVDTRREKTIINSSRQIIYASWGKDFAEAARKAALTLRDQINQHLSTL